MSGANDLDADGLPIGLQAELDARMPHTGDVWRHYRGGEYEVVAPVLIEATKERAFAYRAVDGSGPIWVRPEVDWYCQIAVRDGDDYRTVTRFVKVRSAVLPSVIVG